MPVPIIPPRRIGPEWAAKCRVCAAPLTRHQHYSDGLCANHRCREAALQADLAAHRNDAAARAGVADAKSIPIVVVPYHHDHGMVIPPDEQREAMRQHIVALASTDPSLAHPASPTSVEASAAANRPSAMASRTCGVCAGYCCRFGHAHKAFLDAATIDRVRAAQPGLAADQLADAYLALVPERHSEGSCLFHGERGCTLPTAMRADICNAYECGGLREARRVAEHERADAMYVVVRHAHAIRRGVFVDRKGDVTDPGGVPTARDLTAPADSIPSRSAPTAPAPRG